MKKYVIGLMSGTSLDGLDICYIEFEDKNPKNFKILAAETIPYSHNFAQRIKEIYSKSALDLVKLDADLGKYFGEQALQFIKKNKIEKLDLIASHGQTIFHNPDRGYTTQIGNGAYINVLTGIRTISDFRYQDIALGGEGAPLVPIGDKILFPEYKYCLNLGGFANISIKNEDSITAFDICPVNIVLNHYAQKLGMPYDEGGNLASQGKINLDLLTELNDLEEYKGFTPKSFGWEMVEKKIIPLIDSYKLSIEDILRTYIEHAAIQITKKIDEGDMIVTGGGAYNQFLMNRIKEISQVKFVPVDNILIDYKEALIFGLLGLLKDQGKNNILSSVTGAKMDHSSGIIYDAFKDKN